MTNIKNDNRNTNNYKLFTSFFIILFTHLIFVFSLGNFK